MKLVTSHASKTFTLSLLFLIIAELGVIVFFFFFVKPSEVTHREVVLLQKDGEAEVTKSLKFAAVGDFGASTQARDVLKTIASEKPDVTLALGDLSYGEVSVDEWCSMVKSAVGETHPFQLVAGNHDTDNVALGGKLGHIYEFASCLPNRFSGMQGAYPLQYFFDEEKLVRFIMISPDIKVESKDYSYQKGESDYTWLEKTIDDARLQGISWIVVGMHKNCITLGLKECEIGTDLLDLLAAKKVDLVLQGHEHGYFRSKQLVVGEGCQSLQPDGYKAACTNDGEDNTTYMKGTGTILAIPGTGGMPLRPIDKNRSDFPYFARYIGSNAEPSYGPLMVEVTSDKLDAYFATTDGSRQDEFHIIHN